MLQRIVILLLLASSAVAVAKKRAPPNASLPAVNDIISVTGGDDWPAPNKHSWLYEPPSAGDAAGKVVIHWFCTPRLRECADDLARLVALRDAGHTYIIAYIDGTKAQAQKLDPIRGSEGVGRGTVAYGPTVSQLVKDLGIAGKAVSIVAGADGQVASISTGVTATALDARDLSVTTLAQSIRAFVSVFDSPAKVKAGDKFTLAITIKLASWLTFAQPYKFELTAPKDLQCSDRALANSQLQRDGQNLIATVTCTAPHGVYEAQGHIQFAYTLPSGGGGVGEDGTTWKFEVTP